MIWDSKTKSFESNDMAVIAHAPAEILEDLLLRARPLFVLRALAEIHLHWDEKRLFVLARSEDLTLHWKRYTSDLNATETDAEYDRKITEYAVAIQEQLKDTPLWESKTNQWAEAEMYKLQFFPRGELAALLMTFDPVVALRAIAEYMLNGADEVVTELLKDELLTSHWRAYATDMEADGRDRYNAFLLNERINAAK